MAQREVSGLERFSLPENLPIPQDDGGADHLTGQLLPDLKLKSTQAPFLQELRKLPRRSVIYCYPKTGRPECNVPDRWDEIPGARGCTPQTQGFASHAEAFAAQGYAVFGLSTQSSEYQSEVAARLSLPFALLSDADLAVTEALHLPTFQFTDAHHGPNRQEHPTLIKRMAWIVHDDVIIKVFYPIFPANENGRTVLQWIERQTNQTRMQTLMQTLMQTRVSSGMYQVTEQRKNYLLSNNKDMLQHQRVYTFLKNSHWAATRPTDLIDASIHHSDCYGVYATDQANLQVAFARIVTDHATFAYLCDVYVDEKFRGQGLAKWIMEAIMANPLVKGYRRFVLATRDAHTLYEKFGFERLNEAEHNRFMEILR